MEDFYLKALIGLRAVARYVSQEISHELNCGLGVEWIENMESYSSYDLFGVAFDEIRFSDMGETALWTEIGNTIRRIDTTYEDMQFLTAIRWMILHILHGLRQVPQSEAYKLSIEAFLRVLHWVRPEYKKEHQFRLYEIFNQAIEHP